MTSRAQFLAVVQGYLYVVVGVGLFVLGVDDGRLWGEYQLGDEGLQGMEPGFGGR